MNSLDQMIKDRATGQVKSVSLNSLKVDPLFWDRSDYNEDAIERYAQLFDGGVEKPILIQAGTKRVIDGFHRIKAAELAGKGKIQAIALDLKDHEIPLVQILANGQHGVPLSHTERDKLIVRLYVLGHYTQKQIAALTGLSQRRVSQILAAARAKLEKTESKGDGEGASDRNTSISGIAATPAEAAALEAGFEDADKRTAVSQLTRQRIIEDQLVWIEGDDGEKRHNTQEETAKKFGLSRQRVGQIMAEFRDEVAAYYSYCEPEKKDGRKGEDEKEAEAKGHTKTETAKYFGITEEQVDEQLVQMTPEPANFPFQITTYWQSDEGCDRRYGQAHPGNLPAWLVKNIIYHFSDPGDHVLDPFAGGGVVIDVCQDMVSRSVEAFDIKPCREDIKQWDIRRGPPPVEKQPQLIFLDPPYSRQKKGEYSDMPEDLANCTPGEFVDQMGKIFGYWDSGTLVFLMSSLREEGRFIDLPFQCEERLVKAGWKIKDHIINPVHRPSSETGFWRKKAEETKLILSQHVHIIAAYRDG